MTLLNPFKGAIYAQPRDSTASMHVVTKRPMQNRFAISLSLKLVSLGACQNYDCFWGTLPYFNLPGNVRLPVRMSALGSLFTQSPMQSPYTPSGAYLATLFGSTAKLDRLGMKEHTATLQVQLGEDM